MSNEMISKKAFADICDIIETSRETALRKVNEELIRLYWRVGEEPGILLKPHGISNAIRWFSSRFLVLYALNPKS